MRVARASAIRTAGVCALLLAAGMTSHTESVSAQAAMDSGYVSVPGGRIFYESVGSGEPVVLIHGGFGDRRMWDPQIAALARTHRVIRYDHRGFGRSSPPRGPYSPTSDLAALLDTLAIPRAHIVGNSMGGGVALDFAVEHPTRVNRLVVVASGANGYPYDEADFATMRAVFKAGETSVDRAAELWLKDPMIAVSSAKPNSAALVRRMIIDNRSVFGMTDWPFETRTPSTYDRLGELRVPVLVIVGDHDITAVRRAADAAVSRIRGARIFRMPNADHLPQLVHPDMFNRRVLAFLDTPQ